MATWDAFYTTLGTRFVSWTPLWVLVGTVSRDGAIWDHARRKEHSILYIILTAKVPKVGRNLKR